jgi:hypothetical protein
MKRLELDILFWASRAALIFLLPPFISDINLYQEYARQVIEGGRWPYLHFHFEYPPLAFPFVLIPGLALKLVGLASTEAFRAVFGLLLLPLDFLVFRRLRSSPPFSGAGFTYVLLTAAMGLLIFDRYDLAVGFMLALPFLGKGEIVSDRRFGIAFGLGGALKLVPLTLAPVTLFGWSGWGKRETWLRFLKYSLLVALPILLSCALAYWLGNGKISFLSHHTGRGVQVESLVGSAVIAAEAFFGMARAGIVTNFGGQHLGAGEVPVLVSRILFYGSLLLSYLGLFWQRRRYGAIAACWIVISGFVTFGYVLSPQFLLWLIPLGLLAAAEVGTGRRRVAWLALLTVAVALTGVHFRFYWSYINMSHLSVAAVLARNLALVALWGASWAWMRRPEFVKTNEIK